MKTQVKKILVPVDFTDSSKNALRYVSKVFRDERIQLILLHVVEKPGNTEEAEENLERMRKLELSRHSFLITHSVVHGIPSNEILKAANNRKVDVVVLGIKDAVELFRASISDFLLKNLECPVITVPESYVAHQLKRITYANDHRDVAFSEVFDNIRNFAQKFTSKVYIFHLYPNREAFVEDQTEPVLEYYLESTDHDYYTVVETGTVDAIKEFVENHHIDLLTVLTRDHGHNVLESEGKLVYELVKDSRIPMLVLN